MSAGHLRIADIPTPPAVADSPPPSIILQLQITALSKRKQKETEGNRQLTTTITSLPIEQIDPIL